MNTPPTPDVLGHGLAPDLATSLMERAPFGILIREGLNVVWVNPTMLQQIDLDRDHLAGAIADPGAKLDERWAGLLGTDERIRITHRDGGVRHLQRISVDLNDASRTVCFFRDVTAEAELESALDRVQRQVNSLATHDPETGLLNRQGVMAALDRQVARSRRYGNALAVIRLSLDAPPQHPADQHDILRELSQEFRNRLRWADEMGRLDRSSFLLVLPETTAESAHRLVAKMHEDGVMPARSAEGWSLTSAEATWQKGDDRRRLLRRVGIDA